MIKIMKNIIAELWMGSKKLEKSPFFWAFVQHAFMKNTFCAKIVSCKMQRKYKGCAAKSFCRMSIFPAQNLFACKQNTVFGMVIKIKSAKLLADKFTLIWIFLINIIRLIYYPSNYMDLRSFVLKLNSYILYILSCSYKFLSLYVSKLNFYKTI